MSFRGSHYIQQAFSQEDRANIISSFGKCISDNVFGEFDGLVCRGTSGLLIAPLLAHLFDKKLMVVRKPNDNSHSEGTILEGDDNIQRFVIIDDFTCSGSTLNSILDGINKGKRQWFYDMYNPQYVGCYFWMHSDETFNKEKIINSNNGYGIYRRLCENKVFAQRHHASYQIDNFK